MDPPASPPPSAASQAEGVFLAWLEREERGQGEDFEALCAQQAPLADELRTLAQRFERARSMLARLKSRPADGTGAAAAAAPGGRYEFRSEIARGGMGVVLEVDDPSLRRQLALKRLLPAQEEGLIGRLQRERRRSRLLAEAQILGQLDHPGIVPVHEVGLDDANELYFTMRRIRGRDFGSLLEAVRAGDREWTLARAVGVLLRVCEAVAYAHSKGVVHRDLKPSNVMVGRFGEVYVMDWGLARTREPIEAPEPHLRHSRVDTQLVRTTRAEDSGSGSSSSLPTLEGEVVGTPAYMPPEQAAGRVEEVGERADVYALGAMLYHLLAGRRPYAAADGSSHAEETLAAVRAGPPEPLSRLARAAPPELVAIAERAMARDPGARYAEVTQLAQDLRAYLEDRVVLAHRTGPLPELLKWVRRNRGAAAALAIALLAVLALALVQTLLKHEIGLARAEAETRAETLRREEYVHMVALAAAALAREDVALSRSLLASCDADRRGWEWHHLSREIDTSDRRILRPGLGFQVVSWSPDGRWIAAGTGDARPSGSHNVLTVWDARTLEVVRELPLADIPDAPAFSPDSARLAVPVRDRTIHVWNVASGAEEQVFDEPDNSYGCVWSPDGARLASACVNGCVRIRDYPGGALVQSLQANASTLTDVCFAPDGRRLYSTGWDHLVHVWDLASGSELRALKGHTQRIWSVDASPDGRFLASGGWDQETLVFDARSFDLLFRLPRGKGAIVDLRWSPDSRLLAVANSSVLTVYESATFHELTQLVGHELAVQRVAFAPGGRELATCAGDGLRLWELDAGGREPLHRLGGETLLGVAFSPCGRWIACKSEARDLEIWDARAQRRLRSVPGTSGQASVRWSPTGELLAVCERQRGVVLYDTTSWSVARRFGAGNLTDVHFSPDGRTLSVVDRTGSLSLWDVGSGTPRWSVKAYEGSVGWPFGAFGGAFSRDGGRIATGSRDGNLRVWRSDDGTLERELRGGALCYLESDFSPDGTLLVASTLFPDALEAFDLATGAPRWCAQGLPQRHPRFSPDGQRLFTADGDGTLGVWDPTVGRRLMALEGHHADAQSLDVDPSGACVVTGGGGGTMQIYDTRPWR